MYYSFKIFNTNIQFCFQKAVLEVILALEIKFKGTCSVNLGIRHIQTCNVKFISEFKIISLDGDSVSSVTQKTFERMS